MRNDIFERRLLELASDVLLAVSRGELPADAPVVTATARAIADLRTRGPRGAGEPVSRLEPGRRPVGVDGIAAAARAEGWRGGPDGGDDTAPAEAALGEGGGPATSGRVSAPIEHVLAVASAMRGERSTFAAACARQGEGTGVSAQAVRNACCRWLGLSAYDWQPLALDGADEAALAIARRVADRQPWARARVAQAFRVPEDRLASAVAAG